MSQYLKEDEKEVVVHLENAPQSDRQDLENGHNKRRANNQADEAAKILEDRGPIEYTFDDNKRVLRMVDIYVCIVSGGLTG